MHSLIFLIFSSESLFCFLLCVCLCDVSTQSLYSGVSISRRNFFHMSLYFSSNPGKIRFPHGHRDVLKLVCNIQLKTTYTHTASQMYRGRRQNFKCFMLQMYLVLYRAHILQICVCKTKARCLKCVSLDYYFLFDLKCVL